MAKRIITRLTDDLDGSDADRTVEFSLDGVNYTIDLSEKNAGKLRKSLDPFLAAGTRVGRSRVHRKATRGGRAAAPVINREKNQAIRDWANSNGHPVSERGRIPGPVVEAFEAAH